MSHIANFDLGVMEREALIPAFSALGWKIHERTTCAGVYGTHALVAKNPESGGYGVVLDIGKDGKVTLKHEAYLLFNETSLGKNMELLKQEYQVQVARNYARAKGAKLVVKRRSNGHVELNLEIKA